MSDKNTWNLASLYSGDDDPKIETDISLAKEKTIEFITKWKDRSDYLENPEVLFEALTEYELWSRKYGVSGLVGYYFGLRNSQNESNTDIKAKLNKLNEKDMELVNQVQFFTLNISKIDESIQHKFLDFEKLVPYKHYLEALFIAGKHTLSDSEEKIINLLSKTSYGNWVQMTSEFLSTEESEVLQEEKNFQELLSLVSDENPDKRAIAAEKLEIIFKKHLSAAEHEMNSILEYKKVSDKMRGFSRPDESRHQEDDVDTVMVDELISAVSAQFEMPKRYYDFKAKMLGLEKLKYYERSVPYRKVDGDFNYEESVKIVDRVLTELDEDFGNIYKDFVKKGAFDVFPRKGKTGGAYCASAGIESPTFILLNHTDKLNDVLTIAHEVGHGINYELIKKHQNNLSSDVSTATTEVASTFMEDFILQDLLKNMSDEERLKLMMQKLDSDIATIFRQTAFYNFEYELHTSYREKGYLPKEFISDMFAKHMASYMGIHSEGSANWWIYVSHFRAFFYVYSYVSGLLISKALQKKVAEDKKFIDDVKLFLSAGTTLSPVDIFKRVGVDITQREFWNAGLTEISNFLDETESLAKKLGKV